MLLYVAFSTPEKGPKPAGFCLGQPGARRAIYFRANLPLYCWAHSLMLFLRLVFVLAMVLRLPCWLFVVGRRGNVDHRVQHQAREQETGGGRHPVDRRRREDGQGHAEDAFAPFGL